MARPVGWPQDIDFSVAAVAGHPDHAELPQHEPAPCERCPRASGCRAECRAFRAFVQTKRWRDDDIGNFAWR